MNLHWIMAAAVSGGVLAAVMLAQTSRADDQDMDHGEHGGMHEMADDAVTAVGVLHHVDVDGRMVNLTHEPIADIGWPQMTMDMAVSDKVDLNMLGADTKVDFTLTKGPDGIYMIDTMRPAGDHMMDGDDMGAHHGDEGAAITPTESWAYTGREAVAARDDAHWEMVPGNAGGQEWVAAGVLDGSARCAALADNPAVMVDRATQQMCAANN